MILLLAGLALGGPGGSPIAVDRALLAQLDLEVIALQQRVKQLEEALAHCATDTAAPAIYTELLQIYAGGPVKVTRSGPVTQVSMPVDLVFVAGTLRLREEATPTLDLLATALKLHAELDITVAAYADAEEPTAAQRKSAPTAWELTAQRATVVGRELMERYGVSSAHLTVAGRGARDPVADNDTTEGRAQNRRIVVEIRPGGSS